MRRLFALLGLLAAGILLAGCQRDAPPTGRKLKLEAFVPTYNHYIHDWLLKQQAASDKTARE
ncbi:MAG: hypothetical protein RLZZ522_757, partial [Verrucomicrobiota bacterium]